MPHIKVLQKSCNKGYRQYSMLSSSLAREDKTQGAGPPHGTHMAIKTEDNTSSGQEYLHSSHERNHTRAVRPLLLTSRQ